MDNEYQQDQTDQSQQNQYGGDQSGQPDQYGRQQDQSGQQQDQFGQSGMQPDQPTQSGMSQPDQYGDQPTQSGMPQPDQYGDQPTQSGMPTDQTQQQNAAPMGDVQRMAGDQVDQTTDTMADKIPGGERYDQQANDAASGAMDNQDNQAEQRGRDMYGGDEQNG